MITIGIDPGLDGAIAAFRGDDLIGVWDIPTLSFLQNGKKRRRVDPRGLLNLIQEPGRVDQCWLEKVHAMPRQGVSSAFTFGSTYGAIEAIVALANAPIAPVSPAKWKKDLRVTSDKEMCRTKAIELYPDFYELLSRKSDHNRAEAILIARWGVTYGREY